jgi:hypothetical protein
MEKILSLPFVAIVAPLRKLTDWRRRTPVFWGRPAAASDVWRHFFGPLKKSFDEDFEISLIEKNFDARLNRQSDSARNLNISDEVIRIGVSTSGPNGVWEKNTTDIGQRLNTAEEQHKWDEARGDEHRCSWFVKMKEMAFLVDIYWATLPFSLVDSIELLTSGSEKWKSGSILDVRAIVNISLQCYYSTLLPRPRLRRLRCSRSSFFSKAKENSWFSF